MTEQAEGTSANNIELFGREPQRHILGERLLNLLDGRGGAIVIGGEAGIGKSALVEDAIQRARQSGIMALVGHCYDLAATPPYGPWIELVRGCRPADDLSLLLNGLSGNDRTGSAGSQTRLYEEVLQLFSTMASRQPLVLVLEDLHWSDPASTDLLRVVARRAAAIPILLIVTYRPDEVAGSTPFGRVLPFLVREARAERLDLHQLDTAAIEHLVSSRFDLSPSDRRRLVDYLGRRSAGNPFYILELLRGLEDERLLVPATAGWKLGDVGRHRLPALLRQVIDDRINRLEEVDRYRLQVAAAIGNEVPFELWSTVLDSSDTDLAETVERAAGAQIVDAPTGSHSIWFRHALFREALYESLPLPRRRAVHQPLAETLGAVPDAEPDTVAWHFQMAGDRRATEWLLRAGERAQRAYAWTVAAERLIAAETMLAHRGDDRDRGWLLYRIGRLRRHADPHDAVTWLTEAEKIGAISGDPVLSAYSRFDAGHIQVLSGNYLHGIEKMISSDSLLDSLPADHLIDSDVAAWTADVVPQGSLDVGIREPIETSLVNVRRGTLVQWMVEAGRLQEARAIGERYVDEVAQTSMRDGRIVSSLGDAWFGLGRVYAALAEPSLAMAAFARALDCYQRIDHHLLVAATFRIQLAEVVIPFETVDLAARERFRSSAEASFQQATGVLSSGLPPRFASLELLIIEGAWDEARGLLESVAGSGGTIASWQHRVAALLARLAREQGQPDLAASLIEDVLPAGQDTSPGTTTFVRAIECLLLATDLALDRDDLDRVSGWLSALDRWLEWSRAERWRAEVSLRHARYDFLQGGVDAARRHAEEAVRLAGDPRQPLAMIAGHRLLGELDLTGGEHAGALEHLSASLDLADACNAPYERALTALRLVELYSATGEVSRARSLLAEATGIFRQLGAVPALQRADELGRVLEAVGAARSEPYGLSPREIEVLRLVAQGMTDAEVAEALAISYRTVTTHLSSIFNKLGVSSRVSATRFAVEHGII